MKSAWRELLSKVAIACVGISSMTAFCGCQTWSPTSWGMPASSRVQPPPTGTVKPQGAYYNNPAMGASAAPVKSTTQYGTNSSTSVVPASAVNPFGSNGSMHATNLNANSGAFATNTASIGFQDASSQGASSQGAGQGAGSQGVGGQWVSGQVSTADYNDNGTGMAQVVTAGSMEGTANYNSDNRMDVNSNQGEGANLQWTGK